MRNLLSNSRISTPAHHGPQSGHFVSYAAASEAKEHCLATLFGAAGPTHGVTAEQIAQALPHNLYWTDSGESLLFLLMYAGAASLITRRIWSRYPPTDGWTQGALLLLFCSLIFAAGAVALSETWVIAAETIRIGTGHLGNRTQRSFLHRHRTPLFGISLVISWLITIASGWKSRQEAATDETSSRYS